MGKQATPAKTKDIFASVVVITDQHSEGLEREVVSLSDSLRQRYSNYEIIIIDNFVPVTEMDKVAELLDETPCIRVVRLSRPEERDICVFAGLESAIGDVVIVKTLNDPVSLVPEFVEKAGATALVLGVSQQRLREGFVNHQGARLFYWYSKRFLKINIPENATYYMALTRKAVNALTRNSRQARHIRFMVRQVGYKSQEVLYKPLHSRVERKSIPSLLVSALNLSTNYSNRPLRFLAWLGFAGSFINLMYAVYVVLVKLFKHHVAEGWTTLSLQSSLMFFLLFMILAFICEYLGRILHETQGEPPYHIADELLSKVSVADTTRRNVLN